MKKLSVIFIAVLAACVEPTGGGTPFSINQSPPMKRLSTNNTPVEFIVYVDCSSEDPRNARNYFFNASAGTPETPFFNYVVLGYSYLRRDRQGYIHLETSPGLQSVLDKSLAYIKPLQQFGVQVLVQIRSGIYTDTEAGASTGLGTMDMACITEFIKELKLLVDKYGLNGFEFYDIGGGTQAYPPATRYLKQFQSDLPLYQEALFHENSDPEQPELSEAEIEALLWIEGGSNLSNLVQKTNEALKATYTVTITNGKQSTDETQAVERTILVRDTAHGGHLLSQIRMAYMPDAYTGADPKVVGNLRYIVNDAKVSAPDYAPQNYPVLWDEARKTNAGVDSQDRYAPFIVDLGDQQATATDWARAFLYKDPTGDLKDSSNQNRYGALYFTGLAGSDQSTATYLTVFSRTLFGRVTQVK